MKDYIKALCVIYAIAIPLFFLVGTFLIPLNVTVHNRSDTVNLRNSKFESLDTSKSSLVSGAWYDSANQYLIVKLNDLYYSYCSLPAYVWADFKNAVSFGKEYNNHIKGLYSCEGVEQPKY